LVLGPARYCSSNEALAVARRAGAEGVLFKCAEHESRSESTSCGIAWPASRLGRVRRASAERLGRVAQRVHGDRGTSHRRPLRERGRAWREVSAKRPRTLLASARGTRGPGARGSCTRPWASCTAEGERRLTAAPRLAHAFGAMRASEPPAATGHVRWLLTAARWCCAAGGRSPKQAPGRQRPSAFLFEWRAYESHRPRRGETGASPMAPIRLRPSQNGVRGSKG
jgi:hypothetical protein